MVVGGSFLATLSLFSAVPRGLLLPGCFRMGTDVGEEAVALSGSWPSRPACLPRGKGEGPRVTQPLDSCGGRRCSLLAPPSLPTCRFACGAECSLQGPCPCDS